MAESTLLLALVQMKVEGGQRSKNLIRAAKKIEDAAGRGAQMVLLPEAMDLGWTHPSALNEAQPIPEGQTAQMLCHAAKKNHIYLCAGLIEKENGFIYNSAILINPQGKIILKHRKINELDIGLKYYHVGKDLSLIKTDFGIVGIIICADAKNSNLLKSMGTQGAALVLSPCSWAVPADHDNLKTPYGQEWIEAYHSPAKAFSMWIAGCSNVGKMDDGPWRNYRGIGCSLIIDPNGKVAVQGPYGETAEAIIYHRVEIREKVNHHP